MSFLTRLRVSSLRDLRPRAGDSHKGGFWSEGKHEPSGYLFGETPPPPGQKRRWESWEGPWYATWVIATAIIVLGLNAKPDTSMITWAHKEAEKELKAEGIDLP
ncbi:hypothetical protein WJX81_008229 [Elliptochloris bilobata]|uniref:NADH-ubiquinone oxidoreductase ESSS subunit n=1 Tax=Elliptochloris bilobata TaxID=381761 RepID=A0AAW1RQC4_9CHLO